MISVGRFYEALNKPTPREDRMEYILLICIILLACICVYLILQLKKTKEYINKVESDFGNNLEEGKKELSIEFSNKLEESEQKLCADYGSKLAESEQKLCTDYGNKLAESEQKLVADFGSKLEESEQKLEDTTDNISQEVELIKNDGFGLLKNKIDELETEIVHLKSEIKKK